jgi:hypothetical protein
MPPFIENRFADDNSEVALSEQIARLQETVCHLLLRNEELREEVRELTSLCSKAPQSTVSTPTLT